MGAMYKILGIVYLIIGLYLANASFDFIAMPGFILAIEKWILLIAAVIIIVAGVMNLMKKSYSPLGVM